MTTKTELQRTFREMVESVSGRNTYIEERMGSRPVNQYCTVFITPTRKLQNDVRTYAADGLSETIRSQSEFECKISVWGGNDAFEVAQRLQSAMAADARNFDIYRICGRRGMSDVIDLTTTFEGKRERRAEFTFRGYANFEQVFNTDFFDRTDVDGVTIGVNHPPPHLDQTGCS